MADNRYPTRIDRKLFERIRDEILPVRNATADKVVPLNSLIDEALEAYFFSDTPLYLERLHRAMQSDEVELIKDMLTPELCMALVCFLVEFKPIPDELYAMCGVVPHIEPDEKHPLNVIRYTALAALLTSEHNHKDT